MALQLRRGTAAERVISGVILAPGELLFTYDDQNLYIGDGVTEGGILVTQRLGGYPIEGTFGNLFLINTVQRTGGVATFVTDLAHGLTPGAEIVITNAPDASYNGAWTVGTVTGTTEFTVNIAGPDLPVQSTALYYVDNGAQFPNGASVVWDQTKQSFILRGLTKVDVGLSNVDNTSDLDKPVSTATQAAINNQALGQHVDVFLNSPTDGQALIYSVIDNGWINGSGGGGGGGGDASFPDTYFAYAGLGESATGKWLGTSTMFTPKSDTNFKSYKAQDTDVLYLETLEWDNLLGTKTTTAWQGLNPGTPGEWAFFNSPSNYYVSSLRLRLPSTKVNTSFNSWINGQNLYGTATYGLYSWEVGQPGVKSKLAFGISNTSYPEDGYDVDFETYYTLYNTGRPIPADGSPFTFQEFSFVSGYALTEGKWVGPAYVNEDYATQAAAEADGWTVVQWGTNSGYRYYPSTGTDGATRVTLPWTFNVAGTACNEMLFSSSAGLLFLPTGETAYQYVTNNPSSGPTLTSPILERWASATNQFYFAINELGGRGAASKCMWKVVNESPQRALVFRYQYRVQTYMQYIVEFTIRESDSAFQALLSPMYNSSGYTYQEVYDNYLKYMTSIDKLGTGFIGNGTYVTQNGYLCDEFNMNCHPYRLTDGVARVIKQNTTNRTWLAPLLSAMADITDGPTGSVLMKSATGYKFASATLLGDPLSDTSKAVTGSWVYNNLASFTVGNGNYYYYDPQTNYIETQLGRRGADGVDRYATILAWTSATVIQVTVNGVNYTIQIERAPSYYSSYQLFYVNFDYRYYDGPALKEVLSDYAKRSNVAYAPTITAYSDPTDGQVLTYDSADGLWKPADPAGGGGLADGDYGDVTVSGSGTAITIDADAVSNTKLANMAASTIKGRATAGTGNPEDLTATQVKTILSLGNVENTALSTWTGSTNLSTLANNAVSNAELADMATSTIKGRSSAGTGDPQDLTAAQVKTILSLSNVENTALSTWTGSTNLTTLANNAVSNAELADMATARIKGRTTAGTGDPEDLTAAQVKSLLSIGNVENTALSTWTGSTSITTLGTIATGTWNGSTISIAKGGTGQTTAAGAINALLPSQSGNGAKYLTTDGTNVSWASVAAGGASNLNELTDVTIAGPVIGEVLRYNGSVWVDQQLGYGDLANAPTNLSQFVNDQNFISDITAEVLNSLSDVTITSPSAAQVLYWDGAKWVNAQIDYTEISGAPTSLSSFTNDPGFITDITAEFLGDLSNVVLTTPVNGNVLSYNGTNWINTAAPPADISGSSIGQLTDVDTTTTPPTSGQGLVWNSSTGNWEPGTVASGPIALDDLTDVVITSAATGEILRFNGTSWVDAQLDYSDLTGTPSLATVAISGSYADLTNKPVIPTQLDDLSDTTIGTPVTGEVLRYDGASWVDAKLNYSDLVGAPSVPSAINDLTDVTVTTPASGQILSYNGSAWVNVPNTGGGGGAVEINDLTDVDTSTTPPTPGQVLKWNGTSWIPSTDNTGGGGGSAELGRGDGGDLDFLTVESAFVFGVYGGGDMDTTTEDKPVEFVSYDVDGGEIT